MRRCCGPFFRLAFGDEDLQTSYQFAMLTMQQLAAGTPSIPALGMQALPNQLALGLDRAGRARVDVLGISRADGHGVRVLTEQGQIRAHAVVVATDPVAASTLLGIGTPMMRAQTSWWFATPVSPTSLKMPFVNPLGPAGGPDLPRHGGLQRGAALRAPLAASRRGMLRSGAGHGGRRRDRGRGAHASSARSSAPTPRHGRS